MCIEYIIKRQAMTPNVKLMSTAKINSKLQVPEEDEEELVIYKMN